MAVEYFANRARSTLASGISAVAPSLTIVTPPSGQDFPTSVPFRVLCGTEIMMVTARAGNVFTVTREIEGTTAATHLAGAVIAHSLTAGMLTDLQTAAYTRTRWEALTNGDPDNPELVFGGDGDLIYYEVPA